MTTLAKNEGIALAARRRPRLARQRRRAGRRFCGRCSCRCFPVGSSAVRACFSGFGYFRCPADTAPLALPSLSAPLPPPRPPRRLVQRRRASGEPAALRPPAALGAALAFALLAWWRADIPNRQDEGYTDLWPHAPTGPGRRSRAVVVFGPALLRQMLRMRQWAGFWGDGSGAAAGRAPLRARRWWLRPGRARWAAPPIRSASSCRRRDMGLKGPYRYCLLSPPPPQKSLSTFPDDGRRQPGGRARRGRRQTTPPPARARLGITAGRQSCPARRSRSRRDWRRAPAAPPMVSVTVIVYW